MQFITFQYTWRCVQPSPQSWKEALSPVSILPSEEHPGWGPQAVINLRSISMNFLLLDISEAVNHVTHGLPWLASFKRHHVIRLQPRCRPCPHFTSFKADWCSFRRRTSMSSILQSQIFWHGPNHRVLGFWALNPAHRMFLLQLYIQNPFQLITIFKNWEICKHLGFRFVLKN